MSDNLFKHSFVIFLSIAFANVFSYLFHILMARSLGPAMYGELESLMAIFLILSIPVGTIQTVITKFAARYESEKAYGKIGTLLVSSLKKISAYGLAVCILIALASPLVADFLRIDSALPVMIVGLAILFSVILPLNRGVLHGTQRFNALAFNNILESLFRLLMGILLVALGWGVNGAILSYGLAYLAAFLAAFLPLKCYLGKRNPDIQVKELYRFTRPVFFAVLAMTLLMNGPTLYVKHAYSAEFAGYWNAALNLARGIVFFGAAISLVAFGKISFSANTREKKTIFRKSLLYVVSVSCILSLIFFRFAEELLTCFFGPVYAHGAMLLRWMGFAVSAIGVLQLWINYRLGAR